MIKTDELVYGGGQAYARQVERLAERRQLMGQILTQVRGQAGLARGPEAARAEPNKGRLVDKYI